MTVAFPSNPIRPIATCPTFAMSSRTLHPHLLLGRIPSGPHRLPLHARTFYCTRLVRNDQPVTERPDANAFEKTLILPKTNFPFYNEVFTTDARLQERTSGELYRWQVRSGVGNGKYPIVELMPMSVNAGEKCERTPVRFARRAALCEWRLTYWYGGRASVVKLRTDRNLHRK